MNKIYLIVKYLGKETFNRQTAKYILIALPFATFVGSSVYISSIGVAFILKAYGISVGTQIINVASMYLGSHIVGNTIKSMVNGELSSEN